MALESGPHPDLGPGQNPSSDLTLQTHRLRFLFCHAAILTGFLRNINHHLSYPTSPSHVTFTLPAGPHISTQSPLHSPVLPSPWQRYNLSSRQRTHRGAVGPSTSTRGDYIQNNPCHITNSRLA